MGPRGVALVAFASAALGAGLTLALFGGPARTVLTGPGETRQDQALQDLANLSTAAEKVAPAVVCVDVVQKNEDDPLTSGSDPHARGHGSGVILDESGLVLTNNHVVKGAERLEVTLPGDETGYPARIVGTDPLTDLAVLRMEKLDRKLPYLKFGDSDKLRVGEWVIAVGNPYGVGHTVTIGVLSGRGKRLPDRKVPVMTDLLQTDAAINPGNSGGPLTNSQAEVIGINTAIVPFAQGIGFAVPSHTASWVALRLIEKGKVVRPYLGLELGRLTPEKAKMLELPAGAQGVVVKSLLPLGPALQAGVKEGDVILTPEDPDAFTNRVAQLEPGNSLSLEVWSAGVKRSVSVKLAEMPAELPQGR